MENEPIDVLVLTPLPEELRALREELGQADHEEANNDFAYVIWRRVGLKDRPGHGCLVAVLPPEKDQLPASNTTHLALSRWSPRCFALMGIAGQLSTKVKLGDVIVGLHVLHWDAKRKEWADVGGESRPDYSLVPVPSAKWGANLANLLRSHREQYGEWQALCARDRASPLEQRTPELHVADVASGSATIDSKDMRQMLSKLSRYLYAVETEAAGALSALHSRNPSALSILIRGVSDPSAGKSESDAVGEGAWRQHAARNAARLLVFLLSTYPIPPQALPHPPTGSDLAPRPVSVSDLPIDQVFQVLPVQSMGENIFYRWKADGIQAFFAQVHFYLWTKCQIEILNADLRYGPRDMPWGQTVVFDRESPEPTDASYRLQQRRRLGAGSVLEVFIRREFESRCSEDYGAVTVTFELSSVEWAGFRHLKITGRLAPGGELHEVRVAWAEP